MFDVLMLLLLAALVVLPVGFAVLCRGL